MFSCSWEADCGIAEDGIRFFGITFRRPGGIIGIGLVFKAIGSEQGQDIQRIGLRLDFEKISEWEQFDHDFAVLDLSAIQHAGAAVPEQKHEMGAGWLSLLHEECALLLSV